MRQRELHALQILNKLREEGETRTFIADLLDAEYKGKIPPHTGGGIFGDGICKLVDSGFIKLYDSQGKDITEEVSNIGDRSDWTLSRGYEVANFLMGREKDVSASLTKKLGEIQSVLGVSVSRLIEDFDPASMRVKPIFGKPYGAPSADVFVLMPFHESFSPIFDDHIHKVCERLKLSCKRADNIFGSSQIINDVWELIANSKIIIADCTGRNPNVFYELGIAHTLGKHVIITTQSAEDIPFDIRHIRYIKYNYTPRGMKDFEVTLRQFILEARNKHA